MFSKSSTKKICEYCNTKYIPSYNQYERQKYCSLKCKWQVRSKKEKELGIFKGGYNRETHIRLWLDAKSITDISAPCHYCGIALYPEKFVIEHKIPRVKLNTKSTYLTFISCLIFCYGCLRNSEDCEGTHDGSAYIDKCGGCV